MNEALAVFARFPRLGQAKTRLEPLLGSQLCLELHRAFVLDTLERTASLVRNNWLYLVDCTFEECQSFSSGQEVAGWRLRLQEGTDLGERMWNAFQELLPTCRRVVVVGTDSPTLPLSYVRKAFDHLRQVPCVLGPAEDGGYCLIGLSQPRPELFRDIEWGESCVLEQTVSRMDREEFSLLPLWYDVDRVEDLNRLRDDLRKEFEGFPRRTRRVLGAIFREQGSTCANGLRCRQGLES